MWSLSRAGSLCIHDIRLRSSLPVDSSTLLHNASLARLSLALMVIKARNVATGVVSIDLRRPGIRRVYVSLVDKKRVGV